MPIVNVILPSGQTYETSEAEPNEQTQVVTTIQHETVHKTDELEVSNVFDAVHDEKFDAADTYVGDKLARQKQNLNDMPRLKNGSQFVKLDHENDNDPTTDSSSISMYRTIYIEPPPNKPAGFPPPTLFTSGSVCCVGDGSFAYIPYHASGKQKNNTKYIFGRAEELGDRSGDNDGLMMQLEEHYGEPGDLRTTIHRVHMSPNPTDPFLLVHSPRQRTGADFIQIFASGIENSTDPRDAVFRITENGSISSMQIEILTDRIQTLEGQMAAVFDMLERLKSITTTLATAQGVPPISEEEWDSLYVTY